MNRPDQSTWPAGLKSRYQQAQTNLDALVRPLLDELLVGEGFTLNLQQAAGLLHDHDSDGPCLLLAGAGSGKTAVMTRRIVYLYLQGYKLDEVWAVTFTNKAAREMRVRVEEILSGLGQRCENRGLSEQIRQLIEQLEKAWIGTFHSLGRRMLELEHPDREKPLVKMISNAYGAPIHLLDPDEQWNTVESLYHGRLANQSGYSLHALWNQIEQWRRELIVPRRAEDEASNEFERTAAQLFLHYRRTKRSDRPAKLDFQDLLVFPARLSKEKKHVREFLQSKFQHVLIDEFQDTNPVQFTLAKQLAAEHGRLFAVGDDAQAIYGWRGADIRNIQKFNAHFENATVRRLTRNYRSSASIVMSANDVFVDDPHVYKKELSPGRGNEHGLEYGKDVAVIPCRSDREERGWLGYEIRRLVEQRGYDHGDMAIFYRVNRQADPIKRYLAREEIPHVELGETDFFELPAVHSIRCVYRILEGIYFYQKEGELEYRDSYNEALFEWWTRPASNWTDSFYDHLRTHPNLFDSLLSHEGHKELEETGTEQHQKQFKEAHSFLMAQYQRLEKGEAVSDLYPAIAELIDFGRSNKQCELTDDVEVLCGDWVKHTETKPGLRGLVEFLENVKQQTRDPQFVPGDPGRFVQLSTLHGVKGLEFPVVFFTGLEDEICPYQHPSQSDWDQEQLEEEKRLFYVGITRAEERLNLLWCRQREWFGSISSFKRSRFLDLLPEDLSVEVSPPRSWTQEVAGWFVR